MILAVMCHKKYIICFGKINMMIRHLMIHNIFRKNGVT